MELLKKYPVFFGVGLLILALIPLYVFLVLPIQKQMAESYYSARYTRDELDKFIVMGNAIPTPRMVEEYKGWHAAHATQAQEDLGRLKARSQELHKYFEQTGPPTISPSYPIIWASVYESKVQELQGRLTSTVPVSGTGLDLKRFGGRAPAANDIPDLQTKYWIADELIRVLQGCKDASQLVSLERISFSDYSLGQVKLPGATTTSAGAETQMSAEEEEIWDMIDSGAITFEEGIELLTALQNQGASVAGLGGATAKAAEVDRSAEKALLGYQPYPFGIKLKLRPAGIPVFISSLLNSEQVIRINGIATNANPDGTVEMQLSCELLDFSTAGA